MGRPVLAQVDAAFRRASLRPRSPPTRFFLNLTERCQLRCVHCITHAPAKSADGSARTMSREVLDALTPHLRHAKYVALTHAGEPTLAPMLEPLLEVLRAPVVHVVTNGMALTERRFLELTRAGIRSWSISLDGATEGTNDTLRLGAKVLVLKERLRAFASLRQEHRLDVRLGVSCTVMRSNVHEVAAVARIVANAKLDWFKVEETFPVNARGEEEARLEPSVRHAAIAEARRVCAEHGVRFVDHSHDREVWRCEPCVMSGDDEVFSLADDFANRVLINPCRAPWEVVCVEPDGAVKPQDFHQPTVGSVLEHDLITLWNSTPFQRRRAYSASHRRCEGAPTCGRDVGPRAW